MCDTLTREIIAQKNQGNCLILTLIWVSENAATSAHVSPYMSRKRLASPQTPTGVWGEAHIALSPYPFLGEGKGRRGEGEE